MQFRIRSQNNHSIHYKMANYRRKKKRERNESITCHAGLSYMFIGIDPNEQLFAAKKVSMGIFNETHTNT